MKYVLLYRRDIHDVASNVFLHYDIVGQVYICYLLPRSCKLQMISLSNFKTKYLQLTSVSVNITARDAVSLPVRKYYFDFFVLL